MYEGTKANKLDLSGSVHAVFGAAGKCEGGKSRNAAHQR